MSPSSHKGQQTGPTKAGMLAFTGSAGVPATGRLASTAPCLVPHLAHRWAQVALGLCCLGPSSLGSLRPRASGSPEDLPRPRLLQRGRQDVPQPRGRGQAGVEGEAAPTSVGLALPHPPAGQVGGTRTLQETHPQSRGAHAPTCSRACSPPSTESSGSSRAGCQPPQPLPSSRERKREC